MLHVMLRVMLHVMLHVMRLEGTPFMFYNMIRYELYMIRGIQYLSDGIDTVTAVPERWDCS